MSVLVWLVPIAVLMGAVGLAAFFWSLKSGQYEDLSGAAERILLAEDDQPIANRATADPRLNKNTQPETQPATGADKRRI